MFKFQNVTTVTHLTILILFRSIFKTKAKFLIRSPTLKKSSRLTAKERLTCTTGGVRISIGSAPLITFGKILITLSI